MPSEIQLQAQCWQWTWNTYPETHRLLFAVPNGGNRSITEAMQFKASGLVPGIPDLVMVLHGKVYAFELKIPGGVLSKDQKVVHPAWAPHVAGLWVIWSFLEFQTIFNEIMLRHGIRAAVIH